jgi:adenosylhomocysteine nucleosidase
MMEFPAIIAALPREVKGLVRGWNVRELPGKVLVYTKDRAVVACAGMGEARAALAVEAALAAGPVTALLSVGLAGACDPALRVGDVVRAGVVVDSRTGERIETTQSGGQVLVSTEGIASVREKARLCASYGAAAVDMEAATVARLARAHGWSFERSRRSRMRRSSSLRIWGGSRPRTGSFGRRRLRCMRRCGRISGAS